MESIIIATPKKCMPAFVHTLRKNILEQSFICFPFFLTGLRWKWIQEKSGKIEQNCISAQSTWNGPQPISSCPSRVESRVVATACQQLVVVCSLWPNKGLLYDDHHPSTLLLVPRGGGWVQQTEYTTSHKIWCHTIHAPLLALMWWQSIRARFAYTSTRNVWKFQPEKIDPRIHTNPGTSEKLITTSRVLY